MTLSVLLVSRVSMFVLMLLASSLKLYSCLRLHVCRSSLHHFLYWLICLIDLVQNWTHSTRSFFKLANTPSGTNAILFEDKSLTKENGWLVVAISACNNRSGRVKIGQNGVRIRRTLKLLLQPCYRGVDCNRPPPPPPLVFAVLQYFENISRHPKWWPRWRPSCVLPETQVGVVGKTDKNGLTSWNVWRHISLP